MLLDFIFIALLKNERPFKIMPSLDLKNLKIFVYFKKKIESHHWSNYCDVIEWC